MWMKENAKELSLLAERNEQGVWLQQMLQNGKDTEIVCAYTSSKNTRESP